MRIPSISSRVPSAVIAKHVAPGNIIYSDGWKGYAALSDYGYVQLVVAHEENYVNPLPGTRTQAIERA